MSDETRIALVGASGLVGRAIIAAAGRCSAIEMLGIARRPFDLPRGARVELAVAPNPEWAGVIARLSPDVLICALGTTWRKAGRSEAAFRAVDLDLVVACAAAAHEAGAGRMVLVSAVGAAPNARNFYLRTKGEAERAIEHLGFDRLDILRPGLLRGERGHDRRTLERLGIVLAPLTDALMSGKRRRYRSIAGQDVARAALHLAVEAEPGLFVHHHDALIQASHRFDERHVG